MKKALALVLALALTVSFSVIFVVSSSAAAATAVEITKADGTTVTLDASNKTMNGTTGTATLESGVLTLNGLTGIKLINVASGDIAITLVGNSTIENADGSCLVAAGALSISGTGKLTANGKSNVIYAKGALTVTDAQIAITASAGTGLRMAGATNITGATLNVTAAVGGWSSSIGIDAGIAIVIKDTNLTVTNPGVAGQDVILAFYLNKSGASLTFSGTSKVNVTATNNNTDKNFRATGIWLDPGSTMIVQDTADVTFTADGTAKLLAWSGSAIQSRTSDITVKDSAKLTAIGKGNAKAGMLFQCDKGNVALNVQDKAVVNISSANNNGIHSYDETKVSPAGKPVLNVTGGELNIFSEKSSMIAVAIDNKVIDVTKPATYGFKAGSKGALTDASALSTTDSAVSILKTIVLPEGTVKITKADNTVVELSETNLSMNGTAGTASLGSDGLTLNGLTGVKLIETTGDLNVKLVGTSTLNNADGSCLIAAGKLNVSGTGTLKASGKSNVIYTKAALNVTDATLDVTSTNGAALRMNGATSFDKAKVTLNGAVGGWGALFAIDTGIAITVKDTNLTVANTGVAGQDVILGMYLNKSGASLTISGASKVNVTATNNNTDKNFRAYGLWMDPGTSMTVQDTAEANFTADGTAKFLSWGGAGLHSRSQLTVKNNAKLTATGKGNAKSGMNFQCDQASVTVNVQDNAEVTVVGVNTNAIYSYGETGSFVPTINVTGGSFTAYSENKEKIAADLSGKKINVTKPADYVLQAGSKANLSDADAFSQADSAVAIVKKTVTPPSGGDGDGDNPGTSDLAMTSLVIAMAVVSLAATAVVVRKKIHG